MTATIKHKGIHQNRLNLNRNQLERDFAKAWEEMNAVNSEGYSALDHLLSENNNNPTMSSQRDASVAATVIQWLGSGVGQGFIADVMKKSRP